MKKPLGHFSDEPRDKPTLESRSDVLILQAVDPILGGRLVASNYLAALVPSMHPKHVMNRAGHLARRPYGDTCPQTARRTFHHAECPDAKKKEPKCSCPSADVPFECPHKLLNYVVFGGRNFNEVRYYYRTEAGYQYLLERNHLATKPGRGASKNRHQAVTDLWKISLRLGVAEQLSIRYRNWLDLRARDKMPERTKNSKHPFRLYLGDEYIIPDDPPFSLSADRGGTLGLLETDCHTEDIAYSEGKNTIEGKITFYGDLIKSGNIHRQYGVSRDHKDSLKVFIVTVNEVRRQAIKRAILDLLGPREDFLLGLIENYPATSRTPPVNTDQFTKPYQRAGYPDFSLKTLSEV
jgi:hypothetical protein